MSRRILCAVVFILLSSCFVIESTQSESMGRSCSSNPPSGTSVHHISITPGGPISIPADANLDMNAVAYDSQNNELNVPISWDVTNGVLQNFGGGSARWSPQVTGSQIVTACTGEIETNLDVNVVPGPPLGLELVSNSNNITADQSIELVPLLNDQFGNTWTPSIPFANWTLPAGTSINLPTDGSPPTLTPGPTGSMIVEISWGQWTASSTFNVSTGLPVNLMIDHDSNTISSDDVLDLCAHLVDQRGNSWPVFATWTTFGGNADSSLSNTQGNCIVFDAGPVGDWTVFAEEVNGMTSGLAISVSAGKLAQISLDNLPEEMNIGEPYPLIAVGYDAAGNEVTVSQWNWSVTNGPSDDPISTEDGEAHFSPEKSGQHTIQVMAAGVPAAIDVEVYPGITTSIAIEILDQDISDSGKLITGTTIELQIYSVDSNGNRDPVNVLLENWTVQNGYGVIENASAGTGRYTFTADGIGYVSIHTMVEGAEGALYLEILTGELDSLEVLLPTDGLQGRNVDFTVKGFDISGNEVPITHPCAVEIITDVGKATCDDNGWTLELDESGEQVVYARIDSADGSSFIDVEETWFGWGNNTQVIIVSSLILVAIISAVLVFLFKHLGDRIEEEIGIIEDEEKKKSDTIDAENSVGLISGLPPPAFNFPPPPDINPVISPGLVSPVFQPTGTSSLPAPPLVSQTGGPQVETPTDPFSLFINTPAEPEPSEVQPQQVELPPQYDLEEPRNQSEPSQEIQSVPIQDDTWGEMSGDWNDTSETISSAAAEFAQISHENRRGDGPRNTSSVPLRPLPGTEKGADGWYFDAEDRPTNWTHSESGGWVQE
ncbi:MAG: hypothetical protein QF440_06500 [Candidatus Thalassarchaeaceae archaeon]|nr:hypothetical protein [Candidatus Thalassarchaeaceae archaeon]